MDREQLKAALREIETHTAEAEKAAASARNVAWRLGRELRKTPEPEPPVVEPEPVSDGMGGWITDDGGFFMQLGSSARNSDDCWWPRGGEQRLFIEQFITEAGGVVETVCVLHNGNPQGKGAIRIPKLEIKTHDGRDIFGWQGPVPIEPGMPGAVVDYRALPGSGLEHASRAALHEAFWAGLASEDPPLPGWMTREHARDLTGLLHSELEKQIANPVTVGPWEVLWDEEGARGGGQGIEPHRFEWRKHFAPGIALAALEMYRVANRTSRCMTDASGAFTWDRDTAYTMAQQFTAHDWMPPAFQWEPETATERKMRSYFDFDGEHFIRAYSAALFIAKETRHPFAIWYLDMLANYQEAVHLGTAGDKDTNPAWWSLKRKYADAHGPNEHCGRSLAHEFRFRDEWLKLHGRDREQDPVWSMMRALLLESCDSNGNPFAASAAIFTNANFNGWSEQKCSQGFEMQLLALAMEDSGDRALMERASWLRDYLTKSPAYAYNLETGEKRGKALPFFELSTHGEFPGGMDALLKLAKDRIESGGVDGGGRNPLNYLNPRRGSVS